MRMHLGAVPGRDPRLEDPHLVVLQQQGVMLGALSASSESGQGHSAIWACPCSAVIAASPVDVLALCSLIAKSVLSA
jgi:hypothetical protein